MTFRDHKLYAIKRQVSRTGESEVWDFFVVDHGRPVSIAALLADLLGYRYEAEFRGIRLPQGTGPGNVVREFRDVVGGREVGGRLDWEEF